VIISFSVVKEKMFFMKLFKVHKMILILVIW